MSTHVTKEGGDRSRASRFTGEVPGLRFAPAPSGGGLRDPDHWIWCGSPVADTRGTYHLFASRWSKRVSFNPHWLTSSEIVRAEADRPEGPFRVRETVLPPRGAGWWDGRMTHNPAVVPAGGRYLLFYTGTTFEGPEPGPGDEIPANDIGVPGAETAIDPRIREAHRNQRIGVAIADRPEGPWHRADRPVLEPRPDRWDALLTTNPAPCVAPDGRIFLVYKSMRRLGDLMHLGLAVSPGDEPRFERVGDRPLFDFDERGEDVEDPFLWHDGSRFRLLAKDMEGGLCGVRKGGILLDSENGVDWDPASVRPAYGREVRWDDGTRTEQDFLERPALLFQEGRPTHFYAATAKGTGSLETIVDAWNLVIPLHSKPES